jgi:hypothetical protein
MVVAGPGPELSGGREPRADRVEREVAGQLTEVVVALDRYGHESVPDGVPAATVASVEATGELGVEPLHTAGQGAGSAEEHVPVRAHEAVRPDLPVVKLGRLAETIEDVEAVTIVEEHRLVVVSFDGNMLDCSVVIDSQLSSHGLNLTSRE